MVKFCIIFGFTNPLSTRLSRHLRSKWSCFCMILLFPSINSIKSSSLYIRYLVKTWQFYCSIAPPGSKSCSWSMHKVRRAGYFITTFKKVIIGRSPTGNANKMSISSLMLVPCCDLIVFNVHVSWRLWPTFWRSPKQAILVDASESDSSDF